MCWEMFEESDENGLLNMFLGKAVLPYNNIHVVHGYLHMKHFTSIPFMQIIEKEIENSLKVEQRKQKLQHIHF